MEPEQSNKICRNCESNMEPNQLFCNQCGQKYTTGKITLASVLSTFFSELFSLDSRIYRSFIALMIPGKLSIEFFKGRHKSFAPPLRIFILSSIVLIAVLSHYFNKERLADIDYENLAYLNRSAIIYEIDSLQKILDAPFNEADHPELIDSLQVILSKGQKSRYYIPLMEFEFPLQITSKKLMEKVDVFNKSEEELIKKYNIEGTFNQWMASQQFKIVKDPKGYQSFVLGRTTLVMLLIMPVVALILKLLYWRRKHYYVEHFIFSMHYHSFAFLLISIMLILWTISIPHILIFCAFFLIGLIYLFFAMKKFYQQGIIKTFLKFSLLNFIYLIFISFFIFTVFMVSFLFY